MLADKVDAASKMALTISRDGTVTTNTVTSTPHLRGGVGAAAAAVAVVAAAVVPPHVTATTTPTTESK